MITLETIQAAAELVQNANNNQAITWTAVAMAAVSNVATWITIWRRGNKLKSAPMPGQSRTCIEHGQQLVESKTKIESVEQDIQEIKTDIRAIRDAVIGK